MWEMEHSARGLRVAVWPPHRWCAAIRAFCLLEKSKGRLARATTHGGGGGGPGLLLKGGWEGPAPPSPVSVVLSCQRPRRPRRKLLV